MSGSSRFHLLIHVVEQMKPETKEYIVCDLYKKQNQNQKGKAHVSWSVGQDHRPPCGDGGRDVESVRGAEGAFSGAG